MASHFPDSVPDSDSANAPSSAPNVVFAALDHAPWLDAQAALKPALEARGLSSLLAPTTLILHDLLDTTLKAMHQRVFRRMMESEFGIPLEDDEQAEALYRTELAEHGAQNFARFCLAEGWQVALSFPPFASAPDQLATITLPMAWEPRYQTDKLVEALGYRLTAEITETGTTLTLIRRAAGNARLATPALLDAAAAHAGMARIFDQLDYGLITFSAVGEVLSVSPALLRRLRVEAGGGTDLGALIPLAFYNDILWGLALAEGNGAFENYRTRVKAPGEPPLSILFNISGYRRADGTIESLWQVVSQDAGGASLSEGSILSEVRINNITRNYVPQLVERKARDAVRLGKTALTNEDRPVAVLFCDIVGFTSYVERFAGNESIIDTLNTILRRVSGSVKRTGGAIDKFMGDCIMALFDSPADAVRAAIDMQSHSEDINTLRHRAGQQTLQLRIGIHWGDVVIGNVGTAERLDWTAIGDVVNTASRIEKGCTPGAILISRSLRDAIPAEERPSFRFGDIYGLQVKGKEESLAVCTVAAADETPQG